MEHTPLCASFQNNPTERPNDTICEALRSMLQGTYVAMHLWDHSFYHIIRTSNHLLYGSDTKTHRTQVTRAKAYISRLRTFGCRVWVRPSSKRDSILATHINKGFVLGYTSTMKNMYYLDMDTNRIKTTTHCIFDEGMIDLEVPTPNSIQLRQAL